MQAVDNTRPQEMLLRYRYPDGRLQAAFPMYVVQDTGDVLVGWLPQNTEIMYWSCPDGRNPRQVPLEQRFSGTLTTKRATWQGPGVLRVIPIARRWQAIHFWDEVTGEFACWYVNLESAKRRQGMVVDTIDWHLDLVLDCSMKLSWKDEDEAASAVGTAYLHSEDLVEARRTGEEIEADPEAWLREVGDWRSFVAPTDWRSLSLPDDWDA